MDTVRKFDHSGYSFEIRMISTEAGWVLRVFMDGSPLKIDGDVTHETQQDAEHQGVGDLRRVIADALETHIKGSS